MRSSAATIFGPSGLTVGRNGAGTLQILGGTGIGTGTVTIGDAARSVGTIDLVSNVEAHVRDKHPEMVGTMSRDQILGMASEA